MFEQIRAIIDSISWKSMRSDILFTKVKSIIDEWDPIRIFKGPDDDEYEIEVGFIVCFIRTQKDIESAVNRLIVSNVDIDKLAEAIYWVFKIMFGFYKSKEDCVPIAEEILCSPNYGSLNDEQEVEFTKKRSNRHRKEQYKRKVANRLRKQYQMSCYYSDDYEQRRGVWKSMKDVGWRRHHKRGWNDRSFIKKLQNSRVRKYICSTGSKGNVYRKMNRKSDLLGE